MKRLWSLLIACGVVAILTPAPASAQFVRPLPALPGLGALPTLPGLPSLPGLRVPRSLPGLSVLPFRSLPSLRGLPTLPVPRTLPSLSGTPSVNPAFYIPRYAAAYSIQVGGLSFTRAYVGIHPPSYYWFAASQYSTYGQTGSYMTGSPSVRGDLALAQQRNIAAAQREAGLPRARAELIGAGSLERGVASPDMGQMPAAGMAAVPPAEWANIASGAALNAVLKEIIAAEAKGAKGASSYIPPLLLNDIRFGHTPAGDLLNLARKAGVLDFPLAFDDSTLAPLRDELEKAFATAAAPVQAGRAPDPEKVARFEAVLNKVQSVAGSVVKNLPFDDAIAARELLNNLSSAVKAMKGNTAAGLIDPKWATEGLSVADLTRHMAKHKLQFGPAAKGGEEAYATMYNHLATYLAVLQHPKK